MLPDDFHKLDLKTRYNRLLKEAVVRNKKKFCHLYKKGRCNAGYTSSSLKKIANHTFDVAESFSDAIDCYVYVMLIPKSMAEKLNHKHLNPEDLFND